MGLNISAKIGRNMEWSAAIPVADASYMIGFLYCRHDSGCKSDRYGCKQRYQIDLQGYRDPVLHDLKYWYIGTHFHGCAPVSMEEYILQEIAVLLDYGLIKMIFFIQSINNGL